ncbi:MAG: alpha/beta hydrolase fold protein [uncultured bacterium]|nr:MAG: alpha/beta hydrolase fold protein [uncultured bacterium]
MSTLEQTTAVEIKETRISLSEAGKGESVFFLHGNPGSRKDFSGMLEGFAADKYRFTLPDRPGHMSSEELINDSNDPWLDSELFAELIDRKCNGKTVLVGYSLGSFIACKIALRYPEKVRGIVMLAPFVMPQNPEEKPSSLPTMARGAVIGTILGILLPLLSQTKMQQHLERVFEPGQLSDEYLETWLPRFTRFETLMAIMTDKNAMLQSLKEVHERLHEIKCPVQVLIGDGDKVCSPEQQTALLSEKLPSVKISRLADAGHALNLTHAGDCLNAIDGLFARL